jgi:hypothetical protein
MPDSADTPEPYIVDHAMTALACDPRVGLLDATVTVVGTAVVVTGQVETSERRDAIAAVLAETLPDFRIDNRVTIAEWPESHPTAEELP